MERTIQAEGPAPAPVDERTQIAVAVAPDVTQAAIAITCPVCRTENRPGERYCLDCGFLLGSPVGEVTELPEEAPTARLVSDDGREHALKAGMNSVGRENADVLIADATVSRRHARLTLEGGQLWVEDEGSTNGTRVGGEAVPLGERRQAHDGDTLRFGNVSLRLVLPQGAGGEVAAAETEPETAPVPRRAMALLIAADGTEYSLWEGRTTVGRRAESDVALAGDPYISGRHAEFLCDESGCSVTDVGSTNGTFYGGERLSPHRAQPLTPGDEIRLGQSVFVIQLAAVSHQPAAQEVAPESGNDDSNTAEASEPAADSG
jgi:pSer/pThr/pTyr-binding forkhead associated (FHA) protein